MKLTELKAFLRIISEANNKYGYQNSLNQFRSAYTQISGLLKQSQTAQIIQQIQQQRQQALSSRQAVLNATIGIRNELGDLLSSKIAHQVNIDRFFSDRFIKMITEFSESNMVTYLNELTQTNNQFVQLLQMSNSFSFMEFDDDEFEEEFDHLNIIFDGAASIRTLKELSKESAHWNQYIHCFSRLAKENDTDVQISSVKKGSLILSVTAAAGTLFAALKVVDKVLDTIMKVYELKKKTIEIKKLKMSAIDDALNLLDKHSKLNASKEAEGITDDLFKEFGWNENDGLYNETKSATKTSVKHLLKFVNSGGKVDGHIKSIVGEEPQKVISDVKKKNLELKEIERKMKALSEAKEILLLEIGEEDEVISEGK